MPAKVWENGTHAHGARRSNIGRETEHSIAGLNFVTSPAQIESMESPATQRATWVGYLLLLVAVTVTVSFCLLVGAEWFAWVISFIPSENKHGIELPREGVMDFPGVKRVLGILVYGVAILPGLAVFWVGEKVLKRMGIPIWKEAGQCRGGSKPWT